MNRGIWVYGGLLVALLLGAWLRWTGVLGSEEEPTDGVVVLRAEAADIELVTYHDEKADVRIERKSDEFGDYAWVDLEERKKKIKLPEKAELEQGEEPAADGPPKIEPPLEAPEPGEKAEGEQAEGEDEAEEEEPEYEVEIKTSAFKGGETATKLVESFAPLEAVRALGDLPPEKLEDLELAEPEAWLEITRKGKLRRLELGGEAYGTRDRYLRDVETGKYYLVDAEVFRPLKYAKSRLPDRRLSDLEKGDIVQVRLEGQAGFAVMVQQNRQDKDAAYWASSTDLERPVEIYANWLDKALRLKGLSYVAEDEKPEKLEAAFSVQLHAEVGTPVTIEVFHDVPEDDGDPVWYARSEFTRGLMKLHKVLAAEASDDVADVIEAELGEDGEEAPLEE